MDAADWSILKATALFSGMPAEDVRTLIGNQSPRVYGKGLPLFRQGDPAAAFFVIVSGWVKLYRITPDGVEVVLHVFGRGETFAEAAMFLGGRYPASAETVTPARLLRIEAAVFRARIKERPELALPMLASASHQLKSLSGQIEQIKVRSAPQRIAGFIIGLAPKNAEGPAQIEFPFEKNLLANRLGMKPESFSRALSKLKPHGVAVEKEAVAIADLGRLRVFANYSDKPGED
jgi:CRP/FNR family transcriptional regulator, dissimilatory nitrate respiration regulator